MRELFQSCQEKFAFSKIKPATIKELELELGMLMHPLATCKEKYATIEIKGFSFEKQMVIKILVNVLILNEHKNACQLRFF